MLVDGIVVAVAAARSDAATILVLRALGLGDLLTGVPALRGLRRHYPDARIVLAAPPVYRGLALLTGAVDDLLPTAGLGDVGNCGPVPDFAVNLHGRGPQSIAHLLCSHPARVLTHRHPDYPQLAGPVWRADLHEVDRWCALLECAHIACDPTDLAIDRPDGYPDRSGLVVIHPGASAAARRWPADRFAVVAQALHDDGHDVVVTGSAGEAELARRVARAAGLPDSAVLAGALDLMALFALISDCRLLVCGDTGVGHIATATATPSILLFGPTPPHWWGPRGCGRHVALWSGDRGDPHADAPDRGLLLITVGQVLDASRAILGECA